MSLIPATILTGFLGSGKTTLLKRVLQEAHGQKIAVIENEFGEENIDNDILVADTNEQIIQMSNGCICCTIREDLRTTLKDLAEKKRKGELNFDRVVIETTGLADPGPVTQTFFMDDEIAESYLLDSILTLVDAKHANQQLNDRQEARRQVGFADQMFISKADLVSQTELDALMHRLKHMNPRAPTKAVHFGEVPLASVLDLHGFNLNAKLEIDPDFLTEDGHHPDHGHGHEGHDHVHGEHCDHPSHAHEGHGHHHHPPPVAFENTIGLEPAPGLRDCHRIDPQRRRHLADARHRVAGAEPPASHEGLDLIDELPVDRHARRGMDDEDRRRLGHHHSGPGPVSHVY
jgi:G3E family GTPase